jgi:predicted HicB family RNase H-like nuclease
MKPPPKDRPPSAELHFRLPAKHYDAIYTKAHAEGVSVPEWVRQVLRDNLRQNPPKPK